MRVCVCVSSYIHIFCFVGRKWIAGKKYQKYSEATEFSAYSKKQIEAFKREHFKCCASVFIDARVKRNAGKKGFLLVMFFGLFVRNLLRVRQNRGNRFRISWFENEWRNLYTLRSTSKIIKNYQYLNGCACDNGQPTVNHLSVFFSLFQCCIVGFIRRAATLTRCNKNKTTKLIIKRNRASKLMLFFY